MSIRLKLSQTRRKLCHGDVHLMPCRIHTEGQHRITEYFKPYLQYAEKDEVKGSFRGHPLRGKIVRVPDTYIGVVAEVGKCLEPNSKNLYVTCTFNSMTFWNWDKPPSNNDAFCKAMEWIEIADVLHSPVIGDKS